MTAMERVLDLLDRVHRNSTGALASCPVTSHGQGHGDRNPSLSIGEHDGRVLLNCQAGCHTQDVLCALGLDWPDLFDEPLTTDRGVKVCEWTYQAKDGSPYLVVERWQTKTGKTFKQHKPGETGVGDAKPVLYRLPEVLAAAAAHSEVWICEGEKCCSALSRLGVLATTGPGGVKNSWRDYYVQWLQGCSVVNVVADNDEVGLAYAAKVEAALRGAEIPVKTWAVGISFAKADIYDHVMAGLGLGDLKPVKLNRRRPKTISHAELCRMEFPDQTWVIDGILPTGLALLSGPPKVGKSSMVLDFALSVAAGGFALNFWPVSQGSVLYLSLDNDSEARLKARQDAMCQARRINRELPIEFATVWQTGTEALEGIREWVLDERDASRRPLLVVADTLTHLDPDYEGDGKRSAYSAATSSLKKWARMATDLDIALLCVHHSRKMTDADWVNSSFTGTNGTTAAAQTLLALQARRGEREGRLQVTGRDVATADYKIRNIAGWRWESTEVPAYSGLHLVKS